MKFTTTGLVYSREAQAVINFNANPDLFQPGAQPIPVGKKGNIVPWGEDNTLPFKVLKMIEKNEVVSSNLLFNIQSAYGLGIKPMMRIVEDGKVVGYEECLDKRVLTFFEDNDVDGFFLEQITDMATFFNVFPEIIVSNDGTEIVSLRHLEASYSRVSPVSKKTGEIAWHYYDAWENGSASAGVVQTPVLSRYNTEVVLRAAVAKKERRFVMQVTMPTPGRRYYAQPYWWSIFQSGWYDLSAMLPTFKKALLKNHLAVRYIVYISDNYWKEVLKEKKIAPGDFEGERKAKEEAVKVIIDFLTGDDNKGGAMLSTIKISPGGSGKPFEDKYVQIVPIEGSIKGGEFVEDAEEASNIISYAMGVHPNLNGATPGKSKGSLGGSDKRELFMIKQAMMRSFRDRLLKPLTLIKRFNNWPENLVFAVPEYEFPTLDKDHSGQKKTIQSV